MHTLKDYARLSNTVPLGFRSAPRDLRDARREVRRLSAEAKLRGVEHHRVGLARRGLQPALELANVVALRVRHLSGMGKDIYVATCGTTSERQRIPVQVDCNTHANSCKCKAHVKSRPYVAAFWRETDNIRADLLSSMTTQHPTKVQDLVSTSNTDTTVYINIL